jgi:hypothetical protein
MISDGTVAMACCLLLFCIPAQPLSMTGLRKYWQRHSGQYFPADTEDSAGSDLCHARSTSPANEGEIGRNSVVGTHDFVKVPTDSTHENALEPSDHDFDCSADGSYRRGLGSYLWGDTLPIVNFFCCVTQILFKYRGRFYRPHRRFVRAILSLNPKS